jgi:hypothetical protein
MNLTTSNKNNADQNKVMLISIVKEMAESTTGTESTKHWVKDALWFDIPASSTCFGSFGWRMGR